MRTSTESSEVMRLARRLALTTEKDEAKMLGYAKQIRQVVNNESRRTDHG